MDLFLLMMEGGAHFKIGDVLNRGLYLKGVLYYDQ